MSRQENKRGTSLSFFFVHRMTTVWRSVMIITIIIATNTIIINVIKKKHKQQGNTTTEGRKHKQQLLLLLLLLFFFFCWRRILRGTEWWVGPVVQEASLHILCCTDHIVHRPEQFAKRIYSCTPEYVYTESNHSPHYRTFRKAFHTERSRTYFWTATNTSHNS